MSVKCNLLYKKSNQRLELDLYENLPEMSSIDLANCEVVFENGRYEINLPSSFLDNTESVYAYINGKKIGEIKIFDLDNEHLARVIYENDIQADKPFLLYYDLIILSFELILRTGEVKYYFTDYLLCISENEEELMNIQNMLKELREFNDSQVGEWLFSDTKKDVASGFYEGKWNKKRYRSLNSYIQLLKQIESCYKNNYSYFKARGKHSIKRSSVQSSYKDVKEVTIDNFNWLMKNADQLFEISTKSGIQYNGKNYMPSHINTVKNEKNWDIYENRVLVSFLNTIVASAKRVYNEFSKDVLDEEKAILNLHGRLPNGFHAPIITIKSLHISFYKVLLENLLACIQALEKVFGLYYKLFKVQIIKLVSLPRKTKIFQEINAYTQTFEMIIKWFQYGEYSLDKDKLILQIKTLDKLFEYFCLIKILKLFVDKGFREIPNERSIYSYEYTLANNDFYQNEWDIANTYKLYKNGVLVTIYFQPVISAIGFENSLKLYRTTQPYRGSNYYTPDFVLKFSSQKNENDEYVIFDAKFSSKNNIKEKYLPDVIRKYSCEVAAATENSAPRMVWVLQGRIKKDEKDVLYDYHNSKIAKEYLPVTSYGILSINTSVDLKQKFWDVLRKNINIL